MAAKRQARHRRSCYPSTPLTVIKNSIRDNTGRSAAVATGTGLALALIAQGGASADGPTTKTLDVSDLTAKAVEQAVANPSLTPAEEGTDATFADGFAAAKVEVSEAAVDTALEQAGFDLNRGAAVSLANVPRADGSVASLALSYVGSPYVWAGASPAGFDCSGLVSYIYAQKGVNLPHSSSAIRYSGTVISPSQAQAGDVIAYPGHVAIYVGNGQMVEAATPESGVVLSAVRGGATFLRIG